MIRFEDVHTAWRDGRAEEGGAYRGEALGGLTLTVPAGKITVLLGGHNSGKSLLALHLLGVLEPDGGRVLVGEKSLWELPEAERHELRDSFGLFRGGTNIRANELLRAGETVRECLCAHLNRRAGAVVGAGVLNSWLDRLDLTEKADTPATDLDSGARRRLALWLALVDDPPVVVIDNPGEAMDCRHLEAMVDIIRGWQSAAGATMLIAVHSLRVARELADTVAVLHDGRVHTQGKPDEILAGVNDDESFERKFGEGLGGYAECDPDRSLRAWRRMTQHDRQVQMAFIIVLVCVGAVLIWFFTSGIIPNPFAS
jgi:ABC-type multidrug transport system ATPase subunit